MVKLASNLKEPLGLLDLLREPFKGIEILVVGDVMLDRWVYTHRIAERRHKQPLLHVLKYSKHEDQRTAGGAAMIARIAKGYGANVRLCGAVGQGDVEANQIRLLLRKENINFREIDSGSGSTALIGRFFARVGGDRFVEHVRIDRETSERIPSDVAAQAVTATRELINARRPQALLLADMGRGVICREVIKELGELLKRRRPPVVALDAKGCWEALQLPLDLAVLSVSEAWNALKDVNREAWEQLGGHADPPDLSAPSDWKDFVVAFMETFPSVMRFLVNDAFGQLLAVERDRHLHGLYRYALIEPPRWYDVQSPVGSECICTTIATLCLSTNARSRVQWDDFFRIAYAMRYVSCVQMGTRSEEIADQKLLTSRLEQERGSNWPWPPIPEGPATAMGPFIWEVVSRREVRLQKAIQNLGQTLALPGAVTPVPEFYAVHPGFRVNLDEAIEKLRYLLKQRLPKPTRLWIHGKSGSGKDFLFEQLVKKVLKRKLIVNRPQDRKEKRFRLARLFNNVKDQGAGLVLNEIDKDFSESMQAELLTLLDDINSEYGDLLVVAVASKPEEELANALLPDTRRRFDPAREDAAAIEIPPFEDRVEDLPYLLVSCLVSRAKGRNLPCALSKPALELLVRTPDLLRSRRKRPMTFTILNAAANRLLQARVDIVDADAMASVLGLSSEESRTVFYKDDGDTIVIDTSTP